MLPKVLRKKCSLVLLYGIPVGIRIIRDIKIID